MKAEPRQRSPRFAILIDAENVSPKFADGLFKKIARLGDAPVRLIYGHFSGPNLKGWASVLPDHALERRDQIRAAKGKNSADMAMVIDAMDLLHDGRINGFCLVSSDSDFTNLAARLRREGANVYGFGEKKTPDCFRRACDRFISLEGLLPKTSELKPGVVPPPILPSSKSPKPPSAAIPILNKAISQIESEDGWALLGPVGQQISKLFSDFDVRSYGFGKLSSLVRKTGAFEIDENNGPMRIRTRPRAGRKPAS
ncbi:NYN domain-containing protein [Nitrobacter sp. NHB1]|uniref:NYN domain-containing protein n=1 Tax=Nitrobacter sp. NHB1 TaxID=3119830 RepID=UPI003FA5A1B2